MHLKILRAAATVALLGGTATFGLGSIHMALAQTTTETVPCNTGDLNTDMTSPANNTVLNLYPGCTYWVTAALPTVSNALTIVGHNASIVRVRSADPFSIFVTSGDLTLVNVNVRNGGGDEVIGGAINMVSGTVNVYGGNFSHNNATFYDYDGGDGGAIFERAGTLTVDGATFTDNGATGGGGGAIYTNDGDAAVSLNHDSFIGNDARSGGAVYNDSNNMVINQGNFRYNSAEYGGAIYSDNTVTANDSLFAMNTGSDEGGAIVNDAFLTLNHSLLTVNYSRHGGGIDNYDTVHLSFDLIYANALDNCESVNTIYGCTG